MAEGPEDATMEDFPAEIGEYLACFDSSVTSVNDVVQKLISASKSEQKLDPLEQAKLDLMSVYALNSLFWAYLVTQGINPKDHGIKHELERIRKSMNRVKEISDKKKAARLDKEAASRFLRNAMWDAEEYKNKNKASAEHPNKTKQRKLN
ncbi:nuclear nucleic acid-binding protein C1D [Denticeps clupeoides]|nr:nuclear nucleic acid-binding protein C1D [Denticeps clupeoides]